MSICFLRYDIVLQKIKGEAISHLDIRVYWQTSG